jgi:hypothetical protein
MVMANQATLLLGLEAAGMFATSSTTDPLQPVDFSQSAGHRSLSGDDE